MDAHNVISRSTSDNYVHLPFNENRSISSKGSYHNYISSVSTLMPKVKTADPRNPAPPLESRNSTLTVLTLKDNIKPDRTEFNDVDSLRKHFEQRSAAARPCPNGVPERRIYILEGLNTDYIGTLGGFFYVDP